MFRCVRLKICKPHLILLIDDLAQIRTKIDAVEQQVQKDGSTNQGGKFEWIDSILVKCLQDGNWLLIDNVNFCR